MTKSIILLLLSISCFSMHCSIFEGFSYGRKFARAKLKFTMNDVFVGPVVSNYKTVEFDYNADTKIRIEYTEEEENDYLPPKIASKLYILKHRGGNGFVKEFESHVINNNIFENKLIYNVNYTLGSGLKNNGFQYGEDFYSSRFTLECFIP